MAFTAWRKWFGLRAGTASPRCPRKPAGRKSTCQLRLEELEERRCPAFTIKIMNPVQDTGPSNSDNYSSFQTPTLGGTADMPNAVLQLFDSTDGQNVNTVGSFFQADSNGNWSVAVAPDFTVSTQYQFFIADVFTNLANDFPDVILDVAENPPTNLALDPGSDTGTVGDNITSVTTPTITGKADKALVDATASNFATTVTLYDSDGVTVLGSGLINRDTGAWSIAITTPLSLGSHTITAKATDLAGNVSTASAGLTLTIVPGTPPPPAAPTGLALDPSTDSGTIGDNLTNFNKPKITGKAEAGSTVQLFDNTTVLNPTVQADSNGNWSITLTAALSDGTHSLTAKATNGGGTGPASTALSLVIDTTPPGAPTAVALDASTDSGTIGDNLTNFNKPQIDGKAEAGSTVQLFDGAAPISPTVQADGGGSWSITLASALTDGLHHLTAKATDAAGNTGNASATLPLTIDTTAPAPPANLALSPNTDSGVVGDNLTNFNKSTITGTAEAGTSITLKEGSAVLGTATAAGGSWTISLGGALGDGVHNLTATATDAAGNTSAVSGMLTLTIKTSVLPPTGLALSPPSSGNITSVQTPTIVGTAEANSTVKVFDAGSLLGSTSANGSGSWSFTTPLLGGGVHTFTAVATDVAANTSAASAPLSVTIQTTTTIIPPPNPVPKGTPSVSVQLARVKNRKRMKQQVTLTNTGTVAIAGPLQFVLTGLNKKIKVVGASPSPSSLAPFGNPVVPVSVGGSLMPGATFNFTLTLVNPRLKKVAYSPKVFDNTGVVLTLS
jgi:large repetitive protein